MSSSPAVPFTSNQIVFIDTTVANADVLLAGIDASFQVVYLNGATSALEQMAAALTGHTGIEAIHLVSHGSSGTLALSGGALTTASFTDPANAAALQTIKNSLTDTADFLLYGCDVAADSGGTAFINALANATGADVAASTNPTGAAVLGGGLGAGGADRGD